MKLRTFLISAAAFALGACASDPVYNVPAQQTVADYIVANQLDEVEQIRKSDRDSWQYVNDLYLIYRGRPNDYLVEFKYVCEGLDDNSILPPADLIHNHRYLRTTDTFRGCIVDKIYAISGSQRTELRNLGVSPGEYE
jgi:hypothetical protein